MAISELLTLKTAGMAGAGVAGISGVAVLLNKGRGTSEEATSTSIPSDVVLGFSATEKPSPQNQDSHSYLESRKTYACFKKLFPGSVEVNRKSSGSATNSNEAPNVAITSSPSSSENSGDVLGCSVASMFGKADKFSFETELAFRNDEYGWALWSVGRYDKAKSKGTFSNTETPPNYVFYQVVFLKKSDSEWNVEGGYEWYDLKFREVSNGKEGKEVDLKGQFHFMIPGSSDNWAKKLNTADQTKEYWGVWTKDEPSKDEGLLQGLSIWAGTSEKPEILGRKPGVDFSEDSVDYGYKRSLENYLKSGEHKGFTKYPVASFPSTTEGDNFMVGYHKFDISSTLDTWYSPFKDKRGKWKAFSDYCKDSSQTGEFKELCPTNTSIQKP